MQPERNNGNEPGGCWLFAVVLLLLITALFATLAIVAVLTR